MMADLTVTPVGTQVKPVPGMSLGEMINAAGAAQAYQQALQLNPVQLERAQAELLRLQQLMPEELAKAQAERKVSEETVAPRISASKSTATTAEAGAEEAKFKLYQTYLKNVRTEASDLLKQPEITYEDIEKKLRASIENATSDKAMIDKVMTEGMMAIPKNQTSDQYRALLANQLVKTVSAESQLSTLFPGMQLLSTGARALPVTTGGALAVQPPGQISGAGIPMEIPPTTEVTDPQTGQKILLGTAGQPQRLTTNVPPEQAALLKTRGDVIAQDMPQVLAKAADAQSRIAIFQNIKKLAPDAFTGPTAERRQMIASFAQMVGIPAYEMETATTDELMKNTNLLALAGGNTDAAREIARFANPNNKMTKEGINRVANQLISIEEMNLARARYMGPAGNDPQTYFNRKLQFDAIADPRLFLDVEPAEHKKMLDALTPNERAKLIFKAKQAKQMGVIP
jgi:hypothetical protein